MNTISTKLQLIMTLMQGNSSINIDNKRENPITITDNDSKASVTCSHNEYAAVSASLTLLRFAAENIKGNKIRQINAALEFHQKIEMTEVRDYEDNSNY